MSSLPQVSSYKSGRFYSVKESIRNYHKTEINMNKEQLRDSFEKWTSENMSIRNPNRIADFFLSHFSDILKSMIPEEKKFVPDTDEYLFIDPIAVDGFNSCRSQLVEAAKGWLIE